MSTDTKPNIATASLREQLLNGLRAAQAELEASIAHYRDRSKNRGERLVLALSHPTLADEGDPISLSEAARALGVTRTQARRVADAALAESEPAVQPDTDAAPTVDGGEA